MKQIFPPEIIEHSTESHFAKNNKSTSIIYFVVLLVIVATLASTPFIYVDVTVQSRGIIRSKYENNSVQSAVYGEIEKIKIQNNQTVSAGDTLIVLNTKKQDEQISHIERNVIENTQFINDINSIIAYQPELVQTSKYKGEYKSYLAQLKEQQLQTTYLKKEKETAEHLLAKDVCSEKEYLEAKNNYESSITREQVIHDQFHSKLLTAKAELELQNLELTSQKEQIKKENEMYVITAPTTGTIIQHQGAQVGNFIVPNQTIAQISPNSELVVECYISPTDIGYLKNNMDVSFQLDAFNYNQWGLAHGKITAISNDIITVNDQPVFRTECLLNNKSLKLKNGYSGQLKKGMTLTGRFFITKRSLYQLAFDKVDNWLNPKLVSIQTK